jgi:hypothetical protein
MGHGEIPGQSETIHFANCIRLNTNVSIQMVPGFETWQKILLKCGANAGSGLQGNLIRANFFPRPFFLSSQAEKSGVTH